MIKFSLGDEGVLRADYDGNRRCIPTVCFGHVYTVVGIRGGSGYYVECVNYPEWRWTISPYMLEPLNGPW